MLLVSVLVGCGTTPTLKITPILPTGDGILRVDSFPRGTIIIATDERLQEEFEKLGGKSNASGFWDKANGFLWVRKAPRARAVWQPQVDKNGDVLPNFNTLGHELMHHSRGYWHK